MAGMMGMMVQLECSFHSGNRFLSLWLRVYMPPDEESGHLCSVQQGQEKEISDASYLVEAQLREGDRLHFSSLFRDLMKTFKVRRSITREIMIDIRAPPAVKHFHSCSGGVAVVVAFRWYFCFSLRQLPSLVTFCFSQPLDTYPISPPAPSPSPS